MTKIYQIMCIIFLIGMIFYMVRDGYHQDQAEQYKIKYEEKAARVDNLEERTTANVAADKQKAKLKKTMDDSQDGNNLKYVPDVSILNKLRESPV